jgi:DNA repair protein RadC
MIGNAIRHHKCSRCGNHEPISDDLPPKFFFRPWHVRGRAAVKAYVESLGEEAHEWLLSLYVDEHLQLLGVDTLSQGSVSSTHVPFWLLIKRAKLIQAKGFILVHNHPSGDPTPSTCDIRVTRRLAGVSRELDVPLLDHLIVAGEQILEIGEWYWGDTYSRGA